MRDWRKEQNDMLIERIQGVPAKQMSQLEAMMDPTNPNVYEANDNDAERAIMIIGGEVEMSSAPHGDLTHHRFRFYPNVWSTFDSIELCTKPKFCMGCTYKHPRCDERGRTAPEQK